ncbi:MAG: hypothetical protein Q4D89_09840 [Arachnia propionica]|uniref:hypothetical protein n=1 Tax=Arachnia propionica TaxID=1750 RepID=UPI00270FEB6F|nr:hypothetical protein [Arachnia propionica]
MRAMQLYGIAIDDVRDIFGAPPERAEQLRRVAAARFPAPTAKRRWGLFKREPALEVDPTRPLSSDVDALLAGQFVAPDRLPQSWQLLQAWLEELSCTHTTITHESLDNIEFDLARRGLPSTHSIRRLGERSLGIPLGNEPGMHTGYSHHAHAVATRTALTGIDQDTLQERTRTLVVPLLDFLSGLEGDADVVVIDA